MKVTREQILDEIRRLVDERDGKVPGQSAFQRVTGIRKHDWYPRFWTKWGEALAEAGYEPNAFVSRIDDQYLLEKVADLVRDLGALPRDADLRLRKIDDPSFPSQHTIRRLGRKAELAARLQEFCRAHEEYSDLIDSIDWPLLKQVESVSEPTGEPELGFVYLAKSGKYWKIGRAKNTGRREYDLAIQLPEKLQIVHRIPTDDPVGIEAYWHKRFADRRMNGEWFDLRPEDVSAFRRRKGFM